MKKNIWVLGVVLVLIGVFSFICFKPENYLRQKRKKVHHVKPSNYVSYHGQLKLENNQLVNEKGEFVRLKGVSTHGIQWYGELANYDNLVELKNEWKANVFRIAMYTLDDGYITDRSLVERVEEIVDLAIRLDMYVIIDWHILRDGNPRQYEEEAIDFFDYMSQKYRDFPHVIYEICNEPNGDVTWSDHIKPYALNVINTIRKNTRSAIVIVGTPNWSQDVDVVVNDPIDDQAVMYAFHFYSGTHQQNLIDKAASVVEKIPLFISEWGVSDANGSGGYYLDEASSFISFMDQYHLSWVNWSLSTKDEEASLLLPSAPNNSLKDEYLSPGGKFVKELMNKK